MRILIYEVAVVSSILRFLIRDSAKVSINSETGLVGGISNYCVVNSLPGIYALSIHMEDVRTELKYAIEGIQTIVEDLDMIVSDFNETISSLDYGEYVVLIKSLRKELASVQVKSWANRLKLKVKEEKEEKAIEEMLVNKMKEVVLAEQQKEASVNEMK